MRRKGKIARLPPALRAELNLRLADDDDGATLRQWLNAIPGVPAMLACGFAGEPINKQTSSNGARAASANRKPNRKCSTPPANSPPMPARWAPLPTMISPHIWPPAFPGSSPPSWGPKIRPSMPNCASWRGSIRTWGSRVGRTTSPYCPLDPTPQRFDQVQRPVKPGKTKFSLTHPDQGWSNQSMQPQITSPARRRLPTRRLCLRCQNGVRPVKPGKTKFSPTDPGQDWSNQFMQPQIAPPAGRRLPTNHWVQRLAALLRQID